MALVDDSDDLELDQEPVINSLPSFVALKDQDEMMTMCCCLKDKEHNESMKFLLKFDPNDVDESGEHIVY